MKLKKVERFWYVGLAAVLVLTVLAGCGVGQASPGAASEGDDEGYASTVLDVTYDGALDVSGQLALGTLRLEEAGDGITSEQAQALLPLWQAIQGGTLQGDAEMNATVAAIEGTMTAQQLATIADMQLTQEDVQAWAQQQGPGLGDGQAMADGQAAPAGGPAEPPAGFAEGEVDPEMAARRAEMENMSEEERAALRATMQASGSMPGGAAGGVDTTTGQVAGLLNPLIRLLAERAGEGTGRTAGAGALLPIATPTPTPAPADTEVPMTDASLPTAAAAISGTLTGTEVVTAEVASGPVEVAQVSTTTQASTAVPASEETGAGEETTVSAAPAASAATSASEATASLDLPRIPESGPRPPFTISVDVMQIAADGTIKVTGTVRNDGAETYEGVRVWGTFYTQVVENPDEKVRQGPPGKPGEGGQEQAAQDNSEESAEEVLRPYGPVEVTCASPYLEPGAECPFSLEITGRDYAAYHLGATGEPVEYRQPATVALSDVSVTRDATGYVRFTGMALNENGFAIENAVVTGTLLDGNGQIVSVESTRILGEIAPGGSEPFDLRVTYAPYTTYQVSAQATQG
jgi:hypothetical protein